MLKSSMIACSSQNIARKYPSSCLNFPLHFHLSSLCLLALNFHLFHVELEGELPRPLISFQQNLEIQHRKSSKESGCCTLTQQGIIFEKACICILPSQCCCYHITGGNVLFLYERTPVQVYLSMC